LSLLIAYLRGSGNFFAFQIMSNFQKMFRIIFIVIVVLIAIPLVNKGKDYWDEKIQKVKLLGQSAEKAVRYGIKDAKEK
jgi:hypothetical protein